MFFLFAEEKLLMVTSRIALFPFATEESLVSPINLLEVRFMIEGVRER